MARFDHRSLRLARQRESAVFRHFVMPVSILVSAVGLVAMLLVLLDYRVNDRWESETFIAAAGATALPLLVLLFRWVRGHFNRQLEQL